MAEFSTLVTADMLAQHLDDPAWVVLDCRFQLGAPDAGQEAFGRAHIPGARYADLEKDLAGPVTPSSGRHPLPEPDDLAAKLGEWGIDERVQVVVYDDAGGAVAARGWWLLRWLGHSRVALLDGGLRDWVRCGHPTDNEVPRVESRVFRPRLGNALWVDTETVSRSLDNASFALVDARAVSRFRGLEEPLDPVAGHIPGALNRPFQDNLDADGRFRKPEDLRSDWMTLTGPRSAQEVVHMCGSGVTACHNILAMEVAGLSGACLYPGSWSEWIRDSDRPVVNES